VSNHLTEEDFQKALRVFDGRVERMMYPACPDPAWGWFWLDRTRGVWEGPFDTEEEAWEDLKNPPWEKI
jgi:hypothetical protein